MYQKTKEADSYEAYATTDYGYRVLGPTKHDEALPSPSQIKKPQQNL